MDKAKPLTIKGLRFWLDQAEPLVGPNAMIEVFDGHGWEPLGVDLRAIAPDHVALSNLRCPHEKAPSS